MNRNLSSPLLVSLCLIALFSIGCHRNHWGYNGYTPKPAPVYHSTTIVHHEPPALRPPERHIVTKHVSAPKTIHPSAPKAVKPAPVKKHAPVPGNRGPTNVHKPSAPKAPAQRNVTKHVSAPKPVLPPVHQIGNPPPGQKPAPVNRGTTNVQQKPSGPKPPAHQNVAKHVSASKPADKLTPVSNRSEPAKNPGPASISKQRSASAPKASPASVSRQRSETAKPPQRKR